MVFIKQQQTPLQFYIVEFTEYLMKLSNYNNNYHWHTQTQGQVQPTLGKHASQLVGVAVSGHTV